MATMMNLSGGPQDNVVWPEIPAGAATPVDNVMAALRHGDADQLRIAKLGLEWLDLLLRKNSDYGSSVWKAPLLAPELHSSDAILVRMTDKINRLISLKGQKGLVPFESYEDTMRDLGAYCLLWLARPESQK